MGLNPLTANPGLLPHCQVITTNGLRQVVFNYSVNTAATDAAVLLEESTNMVAWTPAVAQTLSQQTSGNLTSLQVVLHPNAPLMPHLFLRLGAQRL